MQSRRERIYANLPEPVTGYELNPERGLFSVIIPEATTNLCPNPSVEKGWGVDYVAVNGVINAVSTWQAYGVYSIRVIPNVSAEAGFYFDSIALAASTTYTASITIQGEPGKIYYIYFATTAGALVGTKRSWIGTGHKQRIHVTYYEAAGANRRVYVTRDARYSDQNVFYADGLQVEEKSYPTTYCDGDMVGFVINENPPAYLWTGTPHASTSTRSAQTRSGGREMNLLDLGLRILNVIGLGMTPLVDQALPIPGFGELPQGTGTTAREFTLVAEMDFTGPRHREAQLAMLEDIFKPDLVVKDQPLILRYQLYDEDEPCGDLLEIQCKYRTGLEGNDDNNHQERLALTFKQYMPYIQSAYSSGLSLGYQTTVANANRMLMRTTAGIWKEMAGGANNTATSILQGLNGGIYLGGNFTNLGDADGDYISMWNGSAFSSLGTGMDGVVNALALGPNGDLYAAGNFNLAGGVANTLRIARWDGTVWNPLSAGISDIVRALAFGQDGNLYVGGNFTNQGDANGDYIVKWTGAAWSSLGSGMDGIVTCIAVAPDGSIYAGGAFTTAGGVAANRIAKWDGSVWTALGSGLDDIPNTLKFGPDGSLYAGGNFTTAGGITVNGIAKWNGVSWSNLGTGTDGSGDVYWIEFDKSGNLYACGNFTVMNGTTLPESVAFWNGSVWSPIDVNLPGTPIVGTVFFDRSGNFYVTFSTSGNAVSATVTASNIGNAKIYPTITFAGPGTLWQLKNYTTGKSIFFNLTLLAGETVTLNLDPRHNSFVSSFRGNILSTILQGSNTNFELLPGDNNLSAYMFGSTGASTAITITWKGQYTSKNGGAWK